MNAICSPMQSICEQFRDAVAGAGLTPPEIIEADGLLHRFPSNGRHGDRAGWYCLHGDGIPAGIFGCWRQGFSTTWSAKADHDMTHQEQQAYRQKVQQMQAQRDAERSRMQAQARAAALQRWEDASPCTGHPYLSAKGVQPYGLRMHDDALLVPVRDASGALQSLQTITPEGSKRFHPNGRVKGCYHAIGKLSGCMVVCEGYATGASIHMATGHAVACAFNAGNLQAVAQALHQKYPGLHIVLAADDDHQTEGNPGMAKARQAALAVGGMVAMPLFTCSRPAKATDFNDLHQLQGLAAVQAVFNEMEGLQ